MSSSLAELLNERPNDTTGQIAAQYGCSERDVVNALPREQASWLDSDRIQWLFEDLPSWGKMTTIVQLAGCIFEVKDNFPMGKTAHGYYNFMDKNSHLHGHMKMENIVAIALISRPFRGTESYCFQFFDTAGATIFKVYLGRDRKRQLLAEQVTRFKQLQQQIANKETDSLAS